ncbi:MAG: DUF4174 domain-containing protein [Pseudomonadota bacterium]
MHGNQLEEVKTDWAGYLERDVIVVWLRDSVLTSWTPFLARSGEVEVRQLAETDDRARLRVVTNCKPRSRGIHLIGKDAGLKKSWAVFASNDQIFSVIDDMPMRQSEMRAE